MNPTGGRSTDRDAATDSREPAPVVVQAVGGDGDAAEQAVAMVYGALASVQPLTRIQPTLESGSAPPQCPSMSLRFDAGQVNVEMDYGAGCTLDDLPAMRLAGQAKGTYIAAFNAFDVDVTGLEFGGYAVAGRVGGSLATAGGGRRFHTTVRLVSTAGATLSGAVTAVFPGAGGGMSIESASLTYVDGAGGRWAIELSDIGTNPSGGNGLRPSAGVAHVTQSSGRTSGSSTRTIKFE